MTNPRSKIQEPIMKALQSLQEHMKKSILGQDTLVDLLLVALISDGHILLEGPPGVAKTTAIKTIASLIGGSFARIQFTPDLLPSDILGGEIYRADTSSFELNQGPIFNQLILADEINRAPAKVQSALLEAMEERQVSLGKETFKLDPLFMVLATQNPIEQEGTYPLPEAQLDRFLMSISLGYTSASMETPIFKRVLQNKIAYQESLRNPSKKHYETPIIMNEEMIGEAKWLCLNIQVVESIDQYIGTLVCATRDIANYDESLAKFIAYGASPRATIALGISARAYALLKGRDYVIPSDVQELAPHVLSHRIHLSMEAKISGIKASNLVKRLLTLIPAG